MRLAGYWIALAQLKVALAGVKRLRVDAKRLEAQVEEAFRLVRAGPPRFAVDIRMLPDDALALREPLCAIVAPFRSVLWKATVPEIPLRGEGPEPEDAAFDLEVKLASTFRQLQADPGSNPELRGLLSKFIRVRSRRETENPPAVLEESV